ncbi:lysin A [Mycobacterium phage QueenHazel]|nr:lysin A [Mycobacterium phage QueenHazel]
MAILRANVDYFWSIFRPRNNKPYGYGGVWSKNDVNRTTDCSGLVTHALDAVINGPNMSWSRHGISTESYRYVGGPGSRGPFGTIRVARPQDIPADAAVKIGLMHGPGGGANSHMSCTIEGIACESSGSGGQRFGGSARHYNNSLYHDWFYLPGPIVGSGASTPAQPQAPGAVYLGRDCSRYECAGERVKALQARLNRDYPAYSDLDEDGEFGPLTEAVVKQFQLRSALVVDGVAGPATLAALGLSFQPQEVPPVTAPKPVIVGPADDQLTMRWNALGGQTLVEAVAEIRDKVLGTDDRGKPGVVMK